LGSSSGGFRTWWRRLIGGSDAEADAVLDNTHLMRLAGRVARRVRAWAAGHPLPVLRCPAGGRQPPTRGEDPHPYFGGPGLAQIADPLSQDAAAGRLGQVIDRWIYTACLIFGLAVADQERTCFPYASSVSQADSSRTLLFAGGGPRAGVFNALLDRTRSRL